MSSSSSSSSEAEDSSSDPAGGSRGPRTIVGGFTARAPEMMTAGAATRLRPGCAEDNVAADTSSFLASSSLTSSSASAAAAQPGSTPALCLDTLVATSAARPSRFSRSRSSQLGLLPLTRTVSSARTRPDMPPNAPSKDPRGADSGDARV